VSGDKTIRVWDTATGLTVARVRQLSRGGQNPKLGRSPNLKPFALTKK